MKKLMFILLLLPSIGMAQNYIWGAKNGSPQQEYANDVVLTSTGERIIVGQFSGNCDFDPGTGTFVLSPNGGFDSFIQKLDANGDLMWVKSFGGVMNDRIEAVVIDENEDIYVVGNYEGSCDFDPGTSEKIEWWEGGYDVFVSKFDSDGNFIWNNVVGGSQDDLANDIHINNDGQIAVVGSFRLTVDFDPDPSDDYSLTATGPTKDGFVLSLDATGDFLWASALDGQGSENQSVHVSSQGDVVTCGYFWGTNDFDPGPDSYSVTSAGNWDIFILKLDSLGDFIWTKTIGTAQDDFAMACAVDNDNNILIGGDFSTDCDFDPGTGTALQAASSPQSFLLKLNASGAYIWARSWGGNGSENVYDLSVDAYNNTYVNGSYTLNSDFDPDTSTYYISSNGSTDMYVTKFGENAEFLWAVGVGGTVEDRALGSAVRNNEVCMVGYFGATADFDPGTGTDNYSATLKDCAIINLSTCSDPTVDSIVVEACNEYTVPSGDETYTTSGIIEDTLKNVYGCDSVLIIDLQINLVDTDVSLDGMTMTANEADADYQWINCDSDSPISGETNQSFTPSDNGDYAVIITDSVCTDTSDCITVTGLGVESLKKSFLVYPNPSENGQIILDAGSSFHQGTLKVYSMSGILLKTIALLDNKQKIQLELKSGAYLLQARMNDKIFLERLIIK